LKIYWVQKRAVCSLLAAPLVAVVSQLLNGNPTRPDPTRRLNVLKPSPLADDPFPYLPRRLEY